jgi:hypothetical protein
MVVAQSNKPESLGRYVGVNENGGQETAVDPEALQRVIAVKLAAQGFSDTQGKVDELMEVASDLFRVYREQSRLLESYLPPIDQRIQAFLNDALGSTGEEIPQVPHQTLNVDRYGLARELSFPQGAQEFHNSEVCEPTLNSPPLFSIGQLNPFRLWITIRLTRTGLRRMACCTTP